MPDGERVVLNISAKKPNTLFYMDDQADEYEGPCQLLEGCSYDYEFEDERYAFGRSQIIAPSSLNPSRGTISPNFFVGTLGLPVLKNGTEIGSVVLEVQSVKAGYREEYREMLFQLVKKVSNIVMKSNSQAFGSFTPDHTKQNEFLYQQFQLIQSIINSENFELAIHRIVSSPVTAGIVEERRTDIRRTKKLSRKNIVEIAAASERTAIPDDHPLRGQGLSTLPRTASVKRRGETADTPENRFIKYILLEYLGFCADINRRTQPGTAIFHNSLNAVHKLESHLQRSFFREISDLRMIRLNSPALQKKEGYLEIYQSWVMFRLAASLIWEGGDDVFRAGMKNVSVLYEYWLYFVLLDIFAELADLEAAEFRNLVRLTPNGLNLGIRQGDESAVRGVVKLDSIELTVIYSYNRTFPAAAGMMDIGTWTVPLRPDFTFSIWPGSLTQADALSQNLLFRIHFDSKYRISNLDEIISMHHVDSGDGQDEEELVKKYKNSDLLKMHAYKDAIRNTYGSYVLYPGSESAVMRQHKEVIPSVGAFALSPAADRNSGIGELKRFLLETFQRIGTEVQTAVNTRDEAD
jgi:predicted component of viral defense system (DUF524 family)